MQLENAHQRAPAGAPAPRDSAPAATLAPDTITEPRGPKGAAGVVVHLQIGALQSSMKWKEAAVSANQSPRPLKTTSTAAAVQTSPKVPRPGRSRPSPWGWLDFEGRFGAPAVGWLSLRQRGTNYWCGSYQSGSAGVHTSGPTT